MPEASKQVTANLVPRLFPYLGFDTRLNLFDTSSMVHLPSTLRFTPDRFLTLPFPYTLTTTPLSVAAVGGLQPPPVQRLWRTYLHPSYSYYIWSAKSLLTS